MNGLSRFAGFAGQGFAAHLHVRSGFSYGQGVAYPEELVAAAVKMGYGRLALTDRDGMYGIPKFLAACSSHGILGGAIVGAEVTVEAFGERGPVVLLSESMEGYATLCRLISRYRTAPVPGGEYPSPKERRFPVCPLDMFLEEISGSRGPGLGRGLVCLTGAVPHGLLARLVERGKWSAAKKLLGELAEVFGQEGLYVELTDDRTRFSCRRLALVAGLAAECGVPAIATNEVTYIEPADHRLSEVVWAAYNNVSLPGPGHRPTDELYLKPPQVMERMFAGYPEALSNTAAVAERCAGAVSLGDEILVPAYRGSGESGKVVSAREKLLSLVLAGARKRYGKPWPGSRLGPGPGPEVRARLRRELSCIGSLGFTSYFLLAHEAKEIAKELGTPATGRGSGANSLVAYCLGLTQPDPLEHRLLFERFMHEGRRKDPPDLDIDTCSELRGQIVNTLIHRYQGYGAAVAGTAATFSLRGGVRAAARALGYSPKEADDLCRHVPRRIRDRDITTNPEESSAWSHALRSPAMRGHALHDHDRYALLLDLAERLAGRLQAAGTHPGGLVVGTDHAHLSEIAPMEHSGMEGLLRVQYDKDGLEAVGLPKLDILGLKMHTALRKAEELASARTGTRVDALSLPPEDKPTYALIRTGENTGMFQLESPGQMALSRRLKPRRLSDITASISLFRPGPMRGDLVTPYVRRRNGEESYSVPLPHLLDDVIRSTFGVLIYQEQILEVASKVAGFSLAEADQIRRAMTKSRGRQGLVAMDGIKKEFLQRSVSLRVPEKTAREIVEWMMGFAAYGFSAAHAASFAELSYASAYMRCHYPAEFFASLLNSQPMGFYSPRVLLNEARRVGVYILPPDVHLSGDVCTVEDVYTEDGSAGDGFSGLAIRVGLSYCKGLSEKSIEAIVEERERRPFASVSDLYHRTPVDARSLANLVKGGFLDRVTGDPGRGDITGGRRELLRRAGSLPKKRRGDAQRELSRSCSVGVGSGVEDGWWHERPGRERIASLPLSPGEEARMQREVLGLDVPGHPLAVAGYREVLEELGVTPAREVRELAHGTRARAAGILECLQSPPTKSGNSVYFLLIEDSSGLLQATIFRSTYERYGHYLYRAAAFLLEGRVEQDARRGFSFVVEKIGDLGAILVGKNAVPDIPEPAVGSSVRTGMRKEAAR